MSELVLAATLSKAYGAVRSLAEATVQIRAGTVHALVGENGAGKSTLVKILAGIVRADGTALAVGGEAVDLATWDRRAAQARGIGIVQQHGASAGTLTVVENAMLGVEPTAHGLLALEGAATALAKLGHDLGFDVDPHARADSLSLGAGQRAELVAALFHGATILILDEPTAVLAPIEVDRLLAMLRDLAATGTTIVIVTHKLDEVRAVADDVTVLRAGRTVATFAATAAGAAARLDVGAIAAAMVGAALPGQGERVPEPAAEAPDLLVVEDLHVRAGELVGIAGVDGNGQHELALRIAGLAPGPVRLAGQDATTWSTARRLAAGLAYVPEDRLHGGLVLDGTVAENLALGRRDLTGRWRVDRARVAAHARDRIAALDIRPVDPQAIVRTLSGGNQQKLVIGRELSRPHVKLVLASQPTRGVDLGAVARIHEQLRAAALAGAGVLVISADLDELLALCHRIVVMLRGAFVGSLAGAALHTATARAELGALMTGASTTEAVVPAARGGAR